MAEEITKSGGGGSLLEASSVAASLETKSPVEHLHSIDDVLGIIPEVIVPQTSVCCGVTTNGVITPPEGMSIDQFRYVVTVSGGASFLVAMIDIAAAVAGEKNNSSYFGHKNSFTTGSAQHGWFTASSDGTTHVSCSTVDIGNTAVYFLVV